MLMLSSWALILIPLFAIPVGWQLISLYIARAKSWSLMDRPGGRHIHLKPVAIVGGIAVISTWLMGLALYACVSAGWALEHGQSIVVTLACTLVILAVGLADDRVGVTPRFRLVSELLVAALTVWFEPGVHEFCRDLSLHLGWTSYPLTLIGLVAVMNAMNLVDGMDGLAGGIFVSIAAAVAFLTGAAGDAPSFQAVSTVMLFPGLIVFLRKNWNPAVTFMGDHGSLAIGYLLATSALSVRANGASHSFMDLALLAVLFSYPVLDMIICMIRRQRSRQPMMTGDRSHMHHRMLRLGLSVRESAGSLIFWQFAMVSPAFLAHSLPASQLFLLLIPSLGVAVERLFLLGRIENARLRAVRGDSTSRLPGPVHYRESEKDLVVAEVIISLTPVLESVQFEERGQFVQVVETLKFFCERKVKGHGFVRVLPDHFVIGIFVGAHASSTPAQIRRDWADALAVFSKTFMLTYSTLSLPVYVREPSQLPVVAKVKSLEVA